MKKKVIIIGPIVDFGGREIMTNLLFNSLKDTYNPIVFSTVNITKDSVALKGLDGTQWTALPYMIYKNNVLVKIASLLTKAVHKRKEPVYFFIKNKLIKPFINFNALEIKIISKALKESDLIIYSDEITGKWLKTIIEVAEKQNIPLLLRPTGQIKTLPFFLTNIKSHINVLAHSRQNVNMITNLLDAKIWNIDQTTALEKELLSLEINENDQLVYGFLGRFSEEKGINELLEVFSKNQKNIVIAGNGPLLNNVTTFIKNNKNSSYLGELKPKQIVDFFCKIDVLVIASFEEGGPIVGVESMAAAKLIIATKVGAMPERLEATANNFWFSHSVQNGLQIAINKVEELTKIERLEIRKKVRDKYINYNSIKVIKNQYLELIEKLMC